MIENKTYKGHDNHLLLYLYIEQSYNSFIKEQGFNFYSNRRFSIEKNSGETILKELINNNNPVVDGLFQGTANVSAVVGVNGAGKTTILKEIFDILNYKSQSRKLVVMEINGATKCIHNFDNLTIECNAEPVYVDDRTRIEQYKKLSEEITTIYFTNSAIDSYNTGSLKAFGSYSSLRLDNDTMRDWAHNFNITKFDINRGIAGGYYEYLDSLLRKHNVLHFQQMIDMICLYKWRANGIGRFVNWFKPDIVIKFYGFTSFVDKEQDNSSNWNKIENEIGRNLSLIYEQIQSETDFNYYISRIYINLLFEIQLLKNTRCKNKTEINRLDISDVRTLGDIKKLIEKEISTHKRFKTYYEELQEFEKKMRLITVVKTNGLKRADLAFEIYLKPIEIYDAKEVTDYIYEIIDKGTNPFVLRYINIGGVTYSSGERALLNMLTRITMSSKLKDYGIFDNSSINNNIIFLIDEIDLYLHPEWQRRLLYELIKSLEDLFLDKNVQIIYSTHSPITLSDIPRGNVVFCNRDEEGNFKLEESLERAETFASNVYSLFDDAFFLDKSVKIGELAKNYIDTIIQELLPVDEIWEPFEKKKILELERKIHIIGDDAIRMQLLKMLYKHLSHVSHKKSKLENELEKCLLREKKLRQLLEDYDTN